jgi:MFS family permease
MTPTTLSNSIHARVNRLTWVLFFGQSIGSAGFIAGSTVGALVSEHLTGDTRLTGVPGAIYMLGGALAAYPAARIMDVYGRRRGLTLGFAVGLAGALLAGVSVLLGSFILFLIGFFVMGAARGANDLARYAAAEMYSKHERGQAISRVVLGGTIGAVLGPALVGPMGRLAVWLGAEELAGPWFASVLLFGLGALLIGTYLRPEPRELAPADHERHASDTMDTSPRGPVRSWGEILSLPQAQAALSALVLGQVVMVMLMAITSIHMKHHGHSLDEIALVITAHTLGMFGPSLISGRLADRWGRGPVIVAGAGMLILACLLAPVWDNTWTIAFALLFLGLGWNFCYVAGGALLTDTLTPAERGRGQGSTDLLINMASGAGSLGSGLVFSALGYTLMAWVSLFVTFVPLLLAVRWMWSRRALAVSSAD